MTTGDNERLVQHLRTVIEGLNERSENVIASDGERAMRGLGFAAVVAMAMVAMPAFNAEAACQRLGFSVNDYGKEGPANDAKALLDKYIAEWSAKNGIKRYRTGKENRDLRAVLGFRLLR